MSLAPAAAATRRYELRALTGMRGIAAWFVVLFHIRLSLDWMPPTIAKVLGKGYLAVDFFFLLSGFVIWLSWSARLRQGGVRAVPRFLWRRLARIWPLHIAILGATLGVVLALAATGRYDAGHYPFVELPLHFLLMQNWGFTTHLGWNDPSWSISTEWAAYLLFPLIALWLDWARLPVWAVVGAIVVLLGLLHLAMAGMATLGTDIWSYGLRRCLIEFSVGGAVCALWQRWRDAPRTPALGAVGCVVLAVAARRIGLAETLTLPAAFAAALLALALTSGRRGNPLELRALHYLGEISYATYLSHFLLFILFKLAVVDTVAAIAPHLIAAYLLTVFAASAALYHWVECPAQAWMNRVPARLRRTGRDAQAASSSS